MIWKTDNAGCEKVQSITRTGKRAGFRVESVPNVDDHMTEVKKCMSTQ